MDIWTLFGCYFLHSILADWIISPSETPLFENVDGVRAIKPKIHRCGVKLISRWLGTGQGRLALSAHTLPVLYIYYLFEKTSVVKSSDSNMY